MSYSGGKIPDQMIDNDVERRIQEELRMRQNKNILNASRAYAAAGPTSGTPSATEYAMNLMAADGNSAYYGAAAAAAHQRAAYGGLGQPAFGMDSASMYARQQQQHAAAAAATLTPYGYTPQRGATGHYGAYGHHVAATPSDIYSQHIMEQRAAAYGSVTQQQQAAAHQQLLAASSPPPKLAPSANSSIVTTPAGTTVPSTETTPLQAVLQSSPAASDVGPKASPGDMSVLSGVAPSTPMTTTSSIASTPRTTSTKKGRKSKKEPHEVIELEDLKIDKWYSGCVPLGLDDDKYWLSELQVYLRSNFGKYFEEKAWIFDIVYSTYFVVSQIFYFFVFHCYSRSIWGYRRGYCCSHAWPK